MAMVDEQKTTKEYYFYSVSPLIRITILACYSCASIYLCQQGSGIRSVRILFLKDTYVR